MEPDGRANPLAPVSEGKFRSESSILALRFAGAVAAVSALEEIQVRLE
ncbi:hypothetical protein [Sphingopyxis sp. MWB1]|nr:hypothetical protein [Sphingopyxis sp. MWB1]